MSEHTPEPWEVARRNNNGIVVGPNTEIIAVVPYPRTDGFGLTNAEERLANARRIVACVNACASIKTETLEKFNGGDESLLEGFHSVMNTVETSEARADASDAALAEAVGLLQRAVGMWGPDPFETADDDFSNEVRAFLDGPDKQGEG